MSTFCSYGHIVLLELFSRQDCPEALFSVNVMAYSVNIEIIVQNYVQNWKYSWLILTTALKNLWSLDVCFLLISLLHVVVHEWIDSLKHFMSKSHCIIELKQGWVLEKLTFWWYKIFPQWHIYLVMNVNCESANYVSGRCSGVKKCKVSQNRNTQENSEYFRSLLGSVLEKTCLHV